MPKRRASHIGVDFHGKTHRGPGTRARGADRPPAVHRLARVFGADDDAVGPARPRGAGRATARFLCRRIGSETTSSRSSPSTPRTIHVAGHHGPGGGQVGAGALRPGPGAAGSRKRRIARRSRSRNYQPRSSAARRAARMPWIHRRRRPDEQGVARNTQTDAPGLMSYATITARAATSKMKGRCGSRRQGRSSQSRSETIGSNTATRWPDPGRRRRFVAQRRRRSSPSTVDVGDMAGDTRSRRTSPIRTSAQRRAASRLEGARQWPNIGGPLPDVEHNVQIPRARRHELTCRGHCRSAAGAACPARPDGSTWTRYRRDTRALQRVSRKVLEEADGRDPRRLDREQAGDLPSGGSPSVTQLWSAASPGPAQKRPLDPPSPPTRRPHRPAPTPWRYSLARAANWVRADVTQTSASPTSRALLLQRPRCVHS